MLLHASRDALLCWQEPAAVPVPLPAPLTTLLAAPVITTLLIARSAPAIEPDLVLIQQGYYVIRVS